MTFPPRNKLKISLLAVIFSLFFFPATGFCIKLTAEGREPLAGREIREARASIISKALEDALRRATLSDGKSPKLSVEESLKYVKSYRVLSEKFEGDDFLVKLEVNIDSKRLKKRLESLAASDMKRPSRKSSISINFHEDPESDLIVKMLSLQEVEREITTSLVGSGYTLAGKSDAADIKLDVYSGVKIADGYVRETSYATLGKITVKAADGEGKIVAEISESSRSTNSDALSGGIEALKNSAARTLIKLRAELEKGFSPGISERRQRSVHILFNGVKDFKDFERIDEIISGAVLGIEVEKRVFGGGGAVRFVVSSKLGSDEIAGAIEGFMPGELSLESSDASSLIFQARR